MRLLGVRTYLCTANVRNARSVREFRIILPDMILLTLYWQNHYGQNRVTTGTLTVPSWLWLCRAVLQTIRVCASRAHFSFYYFARCFLLARISKSEQKAAKDAKLHIDLRVLCGLLFQSCTIFWVAADGRAKLFASLRRFP
jgi:hypothetical protein